MEDVLVANVVGTDDVVPLMEPLVAERGRAEEVEAAR